MALSCVNFVVLFDNVLQNRSDEEERVSVTLKKVAAVPKNSIVVQSLSCNLSRLGVVLSYL
jgi:hypothetical protein